MAIALHMFTSALGRDVGDAQILIPGSLPDAGVLSAADACSRSSQRDRPRSLLAGSSADNRCHDDAFASLAIKACDRASCRRPSRCYASRALLIVQWAAGDASAPGTAFAIRMRADSDSYGD